MAQPPYDPDTGRTKDSVEQLEESEPANPITEDAQLAEPGEGFEPETSGPETRPEEDEGPPGRTTQMPR